MTKGKARAKAHRALATRLTLIWLPSDARRSQRKWRVENGRFWFNAHLEPNLTFSLFDVPLPKGQHPSLTHFLALEHSENGIDTRIFCQQNATYIHAMRKDAHRTEIMGIEDGETKWITTDGHHTDDFKQFLAHWLPIFRRNCFLSGCPLECTAHEQLEWTKWLREKQPHIENF